MAAVIRSVVDDMKQDIPARHITAASSNKIKLNCLVQLKVGGFNSEVQHLLM